MECYSKSYCQKVYLQIPEQSHIRDLPSQKRYQIWKFSNLSAITPTCHVYFLNWVQMYIHIASCLYYIIKYPGRRWYGIRDPSASNPFFLHTYPFVYHRWTLFHHSISSVWDTLYSSLWVVHCCNNGNIRRTDHNILYGSTGTILWEE